MALIVATGTPETLAAKAATRTIPIVFQVGIDPADIGLVPSLNRPGGNLTGVTNLNAEVGPKRLELLRELLPTAPVMAPARPRAESKPAQSQSGIAARAARRRGSWCSSARRGSSAWASSASEGAGAPGGPVADAADWLINTAGGWVAARGPEVTSPAAVLGDRFWAPGAWVNEGSRRRGRIALRDQWSALGSAASRRRFCAIAASVNSSCAPQGPRSRRRPNLRMRLR